MKNWGLILLLFWLTILRKTLVKGEDGFVGRKGVQLTLNGKAFYANGFNAYWLMYEASNPSTRQQVSNAFQEAQSYGLTIARTWAFSDGGYSPLQSSPGVYNEQMFQMNVEKLMKMAGAVRTGGKGSVRRKKKAVHKPIITDDKRLQSTFKKLQINPIQAIEEVNIFIDDHVIQFQNPKVQASVAANTWVVSGSPQTKKLQDILPGIINQLGTENLEDLIKLTGQFQKGAANANKEGTGLDTVDEDDDEVPELIGDETFEAVAEEGQKS